MENFKTVAIALFLLLALLLGPLATIASLNTLFGLGIPYNIYTWLSVMWMGIIINGSSIRSDK